MAGDTAIDVAGMTKRFGNLTAVDRIDLSVRKGNGIHEVAPQIGPIALFAAVALFIGVKRYRRTLD
jgi:ABC-type branched-subunit amino acid transport system ATPase component